MTDFWRLSLAEQSAMVTGGEISPTELTDAALARIEDLDPGSRLRRPRSLPAAVLALCMDCRSD